MGARPRVRGPGPLHGCAGSHRRVPRTSVAPTIPGRTTHRVNGDSLCLALDRGLARAAETGGLMGGREGGSQESRVAGDVIPDNDGTKNSGRGRGKREWALRASVRWAAGGRDDAGVQAADLPFPFSPHFPFARVGRVRPLLPHSPIPSPILTRNSFGACLRRARRLSACR